MNTVKYVVYPVIANGYCFCTPYGADLQAALRNANATNCQQVCNVCAGNCAGVAGNGGGNAWGGAGYGANQQRFGGAGGGLGPARCNVCLGFCSAVA